MVHDVEIRTARLRLRPWRIGDATFHHRLWEERDERVPARRHISADGHPTVVDLEERIRNYDSIPEPGLLVVEQELTEIPMGYCGLVENSAGQPDEPELAFEFLQEFWGQGFGTEASHAVVDRAEIIGYRHLASTVREWNTASFNVFGKLGFKSTGEREPDSVHGDSFLMRLSLR